MVKIYKIELGYVYRCHYCFFIAAITNYSKFSGLKQPSFIISEFCRLEVHVDLARFSARGFLVLKSRNRRPEFICRGSGKGSTSRLTVWQNSYFHAVVGLRFLFCCCLS